MFKNIARTVVQLWCDRKWASGKSWIECNKSHVITEAMLFLIEQGLVNPDDSIEFLAESWPDHRSEIFDPHDTEKFYLSWTQSAGAANIAANIIDQFSRPYIIKELLNRDRDHTSLLDFGCGTAAVSLLWQKTVTPQATLYLADVNNLSRDFTAYFRAKNANIKIELSPLTLDNIPFESLDIILCIHVLEHIANPVEVLKLLHSKLKKNGTILLEAPWGGHPEHIQEAIDDWKAENGDAFLRNNYKLEHHLNPFITYNKGLSGVYTKK